MGTRYIGLGKAVLTCTYILCFERKQEKCQNFSACKNLLDIAWANFYNENGCFYNCASSWLFLLLSLYHMSRDARKPVPIFGVSDKVRQTGLYRHGIMLEA